MFALTSFRFSTRPWRVYGFARAFGVCGIRPAEGIGCPRRLLDECDGCNKGWWCCCVGPSRRELVGVTCQFRAAPKGLCCWRLLSKRDEEVEELFTGVPYPLLVGPFFPANTEPLIILIRMTLGYRWRLELFRTMWLFGTLSPCVSHYTLPQWSIVYWYQVTSGF